MKKACFSSLSCFLKKQFTFPKTSNTINVIILALLLLSCFLPLLVNPDTVYADDTFIKLSDPTTPPTGTGYGVAFSFDSTYMAVVHKNSPYVTIYKRNGDIFTKLADPTTPPAGAAWGVAFSHDSTYMAVAHDNSPYVSIYKRDGDTFTKLANPDIPPTGGGFNVAFSHDDTYMAVAHRNTPYITIYQRNGDTFTKLPNPEDLPPPTTSGIGVAFSHDSVYMAVTYGASPHIIIYKQSGGTFTKLPDPEDLPAGIGRGITFSHDSTYLAVAHDSTPFITIYKRSGDTFTKLPNPTSLPQAILAADVAFSHDSSYLAVAHYPRFFGGTVITIYSRNGDTFTKLPDPALFPTVAGSGVDFSPNSAYLAISHDSTPYVTIYKIVPAPTVVSAVTNATGTVITVTFDKNMANPAGKHGEFSYKVNGGAAQNFSAAALNADNTKVDLTCAGTTIAGGDTVTVSYTKGTVLAADGGVLESFTDQPVTNNMPIPPNFVSAATNATGTTITITFNKNMANPAGKHGEFSYKVNGGAAQNFSAAALNADNTKVDLTCAGTTIAGGDTVTVSYTKGTVLAADGGVLESFADQPVTNNVPQPSQQVDTATGTGVATFTTSNGNVTGLTAIAENTLPTAGKPPGVTFPNGLFSFNITNIPAGSSVIVTITLPSAVPVGTQYWKYQNESWVDCTSLLGDDDGDNILTLTLTDGDLGDADGVANGVIVDPGGPTGGGRGSASSSSLQVPEHFMPAPARLTIKYLNVQPQQAQAGKPITIFANIANSGDEASTYAATLKINGQVEKIKSGKIVGHAAVPLKFEVVESTPGIYNVDINGQHASFTIIDPDSNNISKNLPLIGLIIFAVVVIAVGAVVIIRRCSSY